MNLITVIVPFYNTGNVLKHCIDSLLAQTLPVDIILVDDGSTDSTSAIADSYAEKHPNISVIHNTNNGVSYARKTGLAQAKSDYIAFVDSDDWTEPEMYEKLFQSLTSNDADIASCNFYKSYESGKLVPEIQAFSENMILSQSEAFQALLQRKAFYAYLWNKLYKKSLFKNIDFLKGNYTGEDFYTLIQVLETVRRVSIVPESLYHYRQSSSSLSRSGFRETHITAFQNYRETESLVLETRPELKKDLTAYLSVEYMSFIIAMSRNNYFHMPMVKELTHYLRGNLNSILFSGVSLFYKFCAAACTIHPKILCTVYHLING